MQWRAHIAALSAGLVLVGQSYAQPRITPIPVSPDAQTFALMGMSADGSTVVGYTTVIDGAFRPYRAFRWTAATGAQPLPRPSGIQGARATAISADGRTIVGTGHNFDFTFALRWDSALQVQEIGTPNFTSFATHDVSANGNVIAGHAGGGHTQQLAGYWPQGVFTLLPTGTLAWRVSADGSVILIPGPVGNPSHPGYRWTQAGGPTPLTGLPGLSEYYLNDLSTDGSVIVGGVGLFTSVAFRWSSPTGMVLLPMPPGLNWGTATGISADGATIVGSGQSSSAGWTTVVWPAGAPAFVLAEYLTSHSVDVTGWELSAPIAVSGDGNIIAGVGFFNGVSVGWLVRLQSCGSADFNNDGDTGTDLDIEAFFACLAGNCCALCGSADFNGDGDVGTDLDVEGFFRVLAGLPC